MKLTTQYIFCISKNELALEAEDDLDLEMKINRILRECQNDINRLERSSTEQYSFADRLIFFKNEETQYKIENWLGLWNWRDIFSFSVWTPFDNPFELCFELTRIRQG